MKIITLFTLILLSCSAIAQQFPQGWTGKYTGKMILGNAGRQNDTIPCDFALLEVEKDSVWTYTMTYYSERFGDITKDYRIVRKAKGDSVNFVLDELNGILMDLTLLNNCFYGMYDVMDMRYISTIRLHGTKNLIIELFAASGENPLITKAVEGEDEIEAKSYKSLLHQTVLLTRKDE